jgi:hypothetical protein
MKSIFPLLLAGISILNAIASEPDLEEAIRSGLVKAHFQGRFDTASSSGHTGKCISLTLSNISASSITVHLEPGRILHPEDEFVQNLVVTEEAILALAPGHTGTWTIFAMCGEMNDGGPGEEDVFSLGGMADPITTKMAGYIWNKGYQNSTGQSAMWVCTDGMPLSSISGTDDAIVSDLKLYASTVLGIPEEDGIRDVHNPISINGSFTVTISKTGKGTLQLYNPRGEVERTIFSDLFLRTGKHTFRYEVNGLYHRRPGYRLVLLVDGAIIREEEVTPH